MKTELKWKFISVLIVVFLLIVSGIGFVYIKQNQQVLFTHTFNVSFLTSNNFSGYKKVEMLLNAMPGFGEINCDEIVNGNKSEIEKAKNWQVPNFEPLWSSIEKSSNQCQALKSSFLFLDGPLTQEEADFPLAYGGIVHKDITQITLFLSSIYRCNNVYMFVVDEKADAKFKERMKFLQDCFPTVVYVHFTTKIYWGSFEIARSMLNILQVLAKSEIDWKYFQYFAGVDLPLKTNLELVRIFKSVNGAFLSDVEEFQIERLKGKNMNESPIPLFKSSLSVTFSRKSANEIVASKIVNDLFQYLKETDIADESIWSTIAGNPEYLQISGGFNGTALLQKKRNEENKKGFGMPIETRPNPYTFKPSSYYISRYQTWEGVFGHVCNGKYTSGSCVFGVEDFPILITRPELMVHKLYLDYQPSTYFCLYKTIWERTFMLEQQQLFSATSYGNIAQALLQKNVPIDNVRLYNL